MTLYCWLLFWCRAQLNFQCFICNIISAFLLTVSWSKYCAFYCRMSAANCKKKCVPPKYRQWGTGSIRKSIVPRNQNNILHRHAQSHWSGVFNLLKFDHISQNEERKKAMQRRLLVQRQLCTHCVQGWPCTQHHSICYCFLPADTFPVQFITCVLCDCDLGFILNYFLL